ncbi:hypothetical protein [Frankia sp. Cppng1_Ct_nod]|uniref:hypothetical protein n=1 Tax=Frankia sp. Cppng1_Ct_nod TaxID=2897162 RepID=UPI0010414C84|nr:hypothetical protein [Frankia sp. Cppng1_Ct_nod]
MNRSDTPSLLLCTLRAVGGAAFLAPALGAKKFGINDDAEGTYLVRLFAARNVALAGGLLASRGEARQLLYKAGIACDALDIAAGLLGFRAGKERSAVVADMGASIVATLLGVAGLMMDRRARGARSR